MNSTSVVYSLLYSMLLLLTYTKDWLCFQCLCIGLSWVNGVSLSLFILLQFVDHGFASLSGARVVRIATHPDFQKVK